jgi:hypothetical protein
VLVAERRSDVPNVDPETVAEIERLNYVVAQSIVLHKYMGVYLPTKRGRGLEYTLGKPAVDFGAKTGFDYMLFLHAEDSFASTGRVALQVLGSPAASSVLRSQHRRRRAARLCVAG